MAIGTTLFGPNDRSFAQLIYARSLSKSTQRMEAMAGKPTMTVGLDMGDRFSHYCLLNEDGDVVEEGRRQSTETAFRRHFGSEPRLRIALEGGTHPPWVSRWLTGLGHEVIVANARKIPEGRPFVLLPASE